MPKFRITAPDGKTYEVTAPDGATQEEVLAYAQSQYEQPQGVNRPAQEAEAAQGARDLSSGQAIKDLGMGAIEGVRSTATGAAQLMAASPASPFFPLRGDIDQYSQQSRQEFSASPAGQSAAGKIGRFGGEMLATAPLAAGSIPAKGAGVLRNIYQGGRAGAAMGAIAEGTPEEKMRMAGTGAVAGGVVAPLVTGAQAATNYVLKKLPRTEGAIQREAAEVLNDAAQNPAAVRQALGRQAPEYVPGSLPTAAEYVDDVGWLALQNSRLSKSDSLRNFVNLRNRVSNEARDRYIRDVFEGADDATYKAIKQFRDDQGAIDRLGLMDLKGVNIRPVARYILGQIAGHENRTILSNVLKPITNQLFRREIPEPMRQANARGLLRQFVDVRGEQLPPNVRTAMSALANGEQTALTSIRASQDPAVQSIMRAYRAAGARTTKDIDDFHRLYNARKTLNDYIEKKGGTDESAAIARVSGTELANIRARLDEQLNKAAEAAGMGPAMSEYLGRFSGASRRMEQNKAGQRILRTAASDTGAYGARTLNVLADPDKLAQRVSTSDGASAALFTPKQIEAMTRLTADLKRQARPKQMGNYLGEEQPRGIGGALALRGTEGLAANKVINALAEKHGERVAAAVDLALQSPQNAAAALAKLPPEWRRKYLRQILPILGISMTTNLLNDIEREAKRSSQYAELPAYGAR